MSDKNLILLLSKKAKTILSVPKITEKYQKLAEKGLINHEYFSSKEGSKRDSQGS